MSLWCCRTTIIVFEMSFENDVIRHRKFIGNSIFRTNIVPRYYRQAQVGGNGSMMQHRCIHNPFPSGVGGGDVSRWLRGFLLGALRVCGGRLV